MGDNGEMSLVRSAKHQGRFKTFPFFCALFSHIIKLKETRHWHVSQYVSLSLLSLSFLASLPTAYCPLRPSSLIRTDMSFAFLLVDVFDLDGDRNLFHFAELLVGRSAVVLQGGGELYVGLD